MASPWAPCTGGGILWWGCVTVSDLRCTRQHKKERKTDRQTEEMEVHSCVDAGLLLREMLCCFPFRLPLAASATCANLPRRCNGKWGRQACRCVSSQHYEEMRNNLMPKVTSRPFSPPAEWGQAGGGGADGRWGRFQARSPHHHPGRRRRRRRRLVQ